MVKINHAWSSTYLIVTLHLPRLCLLPLLLAGWLAGCCCFAPFQQNIHSEWCIRCCWCWWCWRWWRCISKAYPMVQFSFFFISSDHPTIQPNSQTSIQPSIHLYILCNSRFGRPLMLRECKERSIRKWTLSWFSYHPSIDGRLASTFI